MLLMLLVIFVYNNLIWQNQSHSVKLRLEYTKNNLILAMYHSTTKKKKKKKKGGKKRCSCGGK